ncbi:MAG: SPOR domain-containing protein [Magnetovibrionaceae bacterium]
MPTILNFRGFCLVGAICVGLPSSVVATGSNRTEEAILDIKLGHYETAYDYLSQQSNVSDPQAEFWLGVLHHHGKGAPRNLEKAVFHYRESAMLGNPDGQNNLGLMYRDGLAAKASRIEAYAWFLVAERQGSAIAKSNRRDLHIELSAAEVRRAKTHASKLSEAIRKRIADHEEHKRLALLKHPVQATDRKQDRDAEALNPDSVIRPAADRVTAFDASPLPTSPASARLPERSSPVQVRAVEEQREVALDMRQMNDPSRSEAVKKTGQRSDSFEERIKPHALRTLGAPDRSVTRPEKRVQGTVSSGFGQAYRVQVGIFRDPKGIQRILDWAEQSGLESDSTRVRPDSDLFRVRVGHYATAQEAAALKAKVNQTFKVQSVVVKWKAPKGLETAMTSKTPN